MLDAEILTCARYMRKRPLMSGRPSFIYIYIYIYSDYKFTRTVLVEVEILVIVVEAVSGGDRLVDGILLIFSKTTRRSDRRIFRSAPA